MVLGDVQTVLRLTHCGTRSKDVGQTVEVVNLRAPNVLNCFSGGINRTTELACNNDFLDIQVLFRINAALERLFSELPCVGRRCPDYRRLVSFKNKEQAFAWKRTAPDAQRAEVLRADYVGTADIEREVERMHIAVSRTDTDLPEPAALGVLEFIEVLLCERAHCGNACGAGRGRNEYDVLLGHRRQLAEERTDTLCIALGFLVDKGKFLNILEGFDVLGLYACLVK